MNFGHVRIGISLSELKIYFSQSILTCENWYFFVRTKNVLVRVNTVTPFKFTDIKVRGFDIMTYSLPFNFAVSYQNYFTVSYVHKCCVFSTQIIIGTLCVKYHQVLRLEHRLELMEILKNLKKKKIF